MAVQLSQLSRDWLSGDNVSDFLDFRIDYVDVAIAVFQDITRKQVPDFIIGIDISAFVVLFRKADGSHVGIDSIPENGYGYSCNRPLS